MNKLAAQHEALAHYIDALFDVEPVIPEVSPDVMAERAADRLGFLLIRVKDIQLAIRAAQVESAMAFPADGIEFRNGLPTAWAGDGDHRALPIIDLRRTVFPPGHAGHADASPYSYLLILRAPTVALACDEVGATIQVAHEAVQWRDARTTRPWLAGMLRANRCAVIDIAAPPSAAVRTIRCGTERLARNLQFAE